MVPEREADGHSAGRRGPAEARCIVPSDPSRRRTRLSTADMGDERHAASFAPFDEASAWRMDRRRFLQLAGFAGLATVAGCVGAPPSAAPLQLAPRAPAAAASSAGLPLALTSVTDLAQSLEYDIARIFRFVSDEVRYEPYAGVLRGAKGILWARAGNSADKALLLGALLEASLVPHRYVSGSLDDAGVQALGNATVSDVATATQDALSVLLGHGGPSGSGAPSALATPDPSVQAFVSRSNGEAAALVATATAQLQAGVGTITTALSGAGVTLPVATAELPDLERTQHVWVQYASGPDWVDADPSRLGAVTGETMAIAGPPMDLLPDAMRHSVVFHGITESVSAGKLAQQVILDHTEFADALVGVPVTFVNAKPDGLKGLGFAVVGALEGSTQYVAALAVGSASFVAGNPLTFGGQGGIDGAFGQPGTNEGETTAEWLEVQILSPGGAPVSARREIFDRVGAVARASGTFDPATLAPVQLVDLDAATPNEYPPCRTVHSFAIVGGSVSGDYFAQDYATNDAFTNVAIVGHLYHFIRDALNAQLAFPQGTRAFCDAPNVASYSVVPGASAGGAPTAAVALDIWHRSFGLQALQGGAAGPPPAVLAGVISEVAERLAGGEGLPPDPAIPAAARMSVGRIFEEAASQGIATQLIRGSLPAGTAYPAETAQRIGESLAAGYLVIVPVQPVPVDGSPRVGWWLVDPATGGTLDELDDGRGVVTVDYSLPLTAEGKAVTFFERMAVCASTYAFAASFMLGAGSANTDGSLSDILTYASGLAGALANLPNVPGC